MAGVPGYRFASRRAISIGSRSTLAAIVSCSADDATVSLSEQLPKGVCRRGCGDGFDSNAAELHVSGSDPHDQIRRLKGQPLLHRKHVLGARSRQGERAGNPPIANSARGRGFQPSNRGDDGICGPRIAAPDQHHAAFADRRIERGWILERENSRVVRGQAGGTHRMGLARKRGDGGEVGLQRKRGPDGGTDQGSAESARSLRRFAAMDACHRPVRTSDVQADRIRRLGHGDRFRREGACASES